MQEHERPILKDLLPDELSHLFEGYGFRPYRTRQVLEWIYRHHAVTFDEMTNLSKADREFLRRHTDIGALEVLDRRRGSDGTEKFLFGLVDGERIETVLIREERRRTLCISTQVGCAMGCRFCLTGKGGLRRNLSVYEMVDQAVSVQRAIGRDEGIRNLVLMGMGEPLENLECVIRAIRIFLSPDGLGFSGRRVTLSTCGILPGIERMAREGLRIQLAISLNASSDRIRNRIMPINRRYPLTALLEVLRTYPLERRRRITFEYVLLRGVNDRREDAMNLARLLWGIPSKVNLIPFNPFPGAAYEPPSDEALLGFQKVLLDRGYATIIRKSRGGEIMAACGQLGTLVAPSPCDFSRT